MLFRTGMGGCGSVVALKQYRGCKVIKVGYRLSWRRFGCLLDWSLWVLFSRLRTLLPTPLWHPVRRLLERSSLTYQLLTTTTYDTIYVLLCTTTILTSLLPLSTYFVGTCYTIFATSFFLLTNKYQNTKRIKAKFDLLEVYITSSNYCVSVY